MIQIFSYCLTNLHFPNSIKNRTRLNLSMRPYSNIKLLASIFFFQYIFCPKFKLLYLDDYHQILQGHSHRARRARPTPYCNIRINICRMMVHHDFPGKERKILNSLIFMCQNELHWALMYVCLAHNAVLFRTIRYMYLIIVGFIYARA